MCTEQEADRVADHVMRISVSNGIGLTMSKEERIARKCSVCEMKEEEEEKLKISRKPSTMTNFEASEETTTKINNVLSTGGSSLDNDTKELMESQFGYDFTNVRIHTDERASKSAQELNAHAYTLGKDVVFGVGRYQPTSSEGQRLLAHELTHVVQQLGANEVHMAQSSETDQPSYTSFQKMTSPERQIQAADSCPRFLSYVTKRQGNLGSL